MRTTPEKEHRNMGFWDGEKCECCSGKIVEKLVTLHRKVKGKYVLIENVPAGVCTNCGMRYFSANVLKSIQESLQGRRKPKREEAVKVFSLADT
jgi:YgiT-type zinc finger domain-containing protein